MTVENIEAWPAATLDGVSRIRLLARVVPNVHLAERVIDAPFTRVWDFLRDIETSVPMFDENVLEVVIVRRRSTTQLDMRVRARFSPSVPFQCEMGEGHIVMNAPRGLYVVGIGVRPRTDGTTEYVQFEGIPNRAGGAGRGWVGRHVERDADALKRIVERDAPGA
jgi:hypothetical protein